MAVEASFMAVLRAVHGIVTVSLLRHGVSCGIAFCAVVMFDCTIPWIYHLLSRRSVWVGRKGRFNCMIMHVVVISTHPKADTKQLKKVKLIVTAPIGWM